MTYTPPPRDKTPLIVIAAVGAVGAVGSLIAALPIIVRFLIAHFVGA